MCRLILQIFLFVARRPCLLEGVAGLYKGITGGKYGTQEGVKEADTEAARMMAKDHGRAEDAGGQGRPRVYWW
jgi:hypothetical protein